jgi:hypothetical protein
MPPTVCQVWQGIQDSALNSWQPRSSYQGSVPKHDSATHQPANILAYSHQLMALARPSAMPPPAVAPVMVCVVDSGSPAGGSSSSSSRTSRAQQHASMQVHGRSQLEGARPPGCTKRAARLKQQRLLQQQWLKPLQAWHGSLHRRNTMRTTTKNRTRQLQCDAVTRAGGASAAGCWQWQLTEC